MDTQVSKGFSPGQFWLVECVRGGDASPAKLVAPGSGDKATSWVIDRLDHTGKVTHCSSAHQDRLIKKVSEAEALKTIQDQMTV